MECFFSVHHPDKVAQFRQAVKDQDEKTLRELLAPYAKDENFCDLDIVRYFTEDRSCELHLDPNNCEIPLAAPCLNCKRTMCKQCCDMDVVLAPYKERSCRAYMCKQCAADYLAAHTPRTELRSGKVYLPRSLVD